MNLSPWPDYSLEEAEAAKEILLSGKVNYWTGNQCRTFELLYQKKFNLNYCITLANGTVALEAALNCLELKKK